MTHDDPEPKVHWGIMVGVSVVIHALVLGGAGFFAVSSSPRRALYAPSMSVSLMGPGDPGLLPGPAKGGGPPASTPPPPKPKVEEKKEPPKPEPKPEPKAKADKPKLIKPEVKPEKPKKKPKPVEKVVKVPKKAKPKKPKTPPPKEAPEKTAKKQKTPKKPSKPPAKKPAEKSLSTQESEALTKIQKRLEDSKALDSIRKRLLARANQTGGGGGGGGGAAGQGSNIYKNEIARIFYSAWVLPRGGDIEDLEAVIVIHIARSGKIIKTEVEKSSGDLYFDESVMRAVGKVKTGGGLPPLPPEIPGQILVQGLLFDPKIQQGLSR
jgi:colicin import membrane protein